MTGLFEVTALQTAFGFVDKGGPIVLFLLALATIATAVILLKLWQFAWIGVGRNKHAEIALRSWIEGKREAALSQVKGKRNPTARVVYHGMHGIANGADETHLREDVERIALGELANLRSFMRVLDATVQLAPLIGLFGTVIGMIYAFQALQDAGAEADPTVLAGGIWVALMTTAVGLAVAIPVAFFNYWLEGRIEREQHAMESALTSLLTGRVSEREPLQPDSLQNVRFANAAE